jgi:hypothetical protein
MEVFMRTRLRSRLVVCLVAFVAAPLLASFALAQDVEPNDSSATASAVTLALGGSLSIDGNLDASGTDFDYYAIAMTERQILIATTKPVGGLFDDPDTQLLVYDTDGTTLIVDNDDAGTDFPEGSEYGSTIRFRAPQAGTYYLVVGGCCDDPSHGETGDYELMLGLTIEVAAKTVDTDPANNATGGADDLGISGIGTVLHVAELAPNAGGPGDVDMYRVALGLGDTLIATTAPFGGVLDVPDTQMGVFDGSTWFTIDDDAGDDEPEGEELGSTVRFKAPSPGDYFLVISGFDDADDGALDGDHTEAGTYAFVASVDSSLEAPEIPTLSQTGLGALVLLIVVAGWVVARRRA